MFDLNPAQQSAISAGGATFLLGPAGTGKTTALQHRLAHLLQSGEPAYTVLVLVAEQEHRQAFLDLLHDQNPGPYADLKITSYTYLAWEMVRLFWPLVARPAGFDRPFQPPTSLSYDLAQILMWRIITPMLREGAFAGLRLRPQQLVSQLLDTLNRAALNALTLQEAVERTLSTWAGETQDLRFLEDARTAATRFEQHCLKNSLLDLALTVRVFDEHLVNHPEFHRYFQERYRHLIVDNVEEQTPAGQQFLMAMFGQTVSMTLAYDAGGGYKRFLSADPTGATRFQARSQQTLTFTESFTSTEPLTHLANLVENHLNVGGKKKPSNRAEEAIWGVITGRYRREMVAQLPDVLGELISTHGLLPQDIAILTPYLDGALRYSLEQVLREAGLPYFLLKRRSSPRDEPRIRAWLTWLALAHPDWGLAPALFDVAEALTLSIAGLDPARAQLLADHLYDEGLGQLRPVANLDPALSGRVGMDVVDMVELLREWLVATGGMYPVDEFLHRLFNELLALPPYQPELDLAGAAVCAWLVRTAGHVRQSGRALGLLTDAEVGRAFMDGIYQGLVTADPPELGEPADPDGVMISTLYGYLLAGRVAKVQVWLEAAATGWWDIPRQPLSNVFVLVPHWSPDKPWTMDEDYRIRNELLGRIVRGLTVRCNGGILLATSDLDRRGQRQDGALWRALQPVLVHLPTSAEQTKEPF